MKRCPACQQTFPEESPDFCPNDGMRLIKEESVAFDPERTMIPSEVKSLASAQPTAPPLAEPPRPFSPSTSGVQPPPPPFQQPQIEQPPPPQQWQPPGGNQFQPQASWPSAMPQPSAPQWGVQSQQQPPPVGLYGASLTSFPSGQRRALAIASLVCGVDIATIMAFRFFRDPNYTRVVMFALPILAIAFAITSLFLALKRPERFGGIDLAIAGLALGVAGLVYVLMRGMG